MIFKTPLPRGGLILPLPFPQVLSTEFRVHWRGGHARPAQTGLKWSPGPMNSFFKGRVGGKGGRKEREGRVERKRRKEGWITLGNKQLKEVINCQ